MNLKMKQRTLFSLSKVPQRLTSSSMSELCSISSVAIVTILPSLLFQQIVFPPLSVQLVGASALEAVSATMALPTTEKSAKVLPLSILLKLDLPDYQHPGSGASSLFRIGI